MKQTKKELLYEIFRFLLVGGLATLVDFGVYELFRWIILSNLNDIHLIITISTILGFLVGNIINYILSVLFVFKGAKDDKKAKSIKAFIIFTTIGVIGLLIKTGVQNLGNYLTNLIFKNQSDFLEWFLDTGVYCVATLIVLVWNYIGRKLFIFKNKTEE